MLRRLQRLCSYWSWHHRSPLILGFGGAFDLSGMRIMNSPLITFSDTDLPSIAPRDPYVPVRARRQVNPNEPPREQQDIPVDVPLFLALHERIVTETRKRRITQSGDIPDSVWEVAEAMDALNRGAIRLGKIFAGMDLEEVERLTEMAPNLRRAEEMLMRITELSGQAGLRWGDVNQAIIASSRLAYNFKNQLDRTIEIIDRHLRSPSGRKHISSLGIFLPQMVGLAASLQSNQVWDAVSSDLLPLVTDKKSKDS
jgi:hypothetical protein